MASRNGQTHHKLVALCCGLFGVLVAAALRPAKADECLTYEPAVVTLTGKITSHFAWGPPGYGEDPKHDAKEGYIALDLDRPICVTGMDDGFLQDPENDLKRLQLLYYPDSYPFKKKWLGKRVSVTGTLFHAISGHHRTPVLITVTETHLSK
ncbi:MAG TPA: DUF4431 domain-containing protein [Magnetospirillaceae bacterium]|jgi:hypothetical protein